MVRCSSTAGAILVLLIGAGLLIFTGCDESPAPLPAEKTVASEHQAGELQPPAPPIREDFEGRPIMSLFPRVAGARPAEDEEGYPYWRSFIEHVARTSGPTVDDTPGSSRCWALRGIGDIESTGFFSPLAVEPSSRYQITARIKTDLTEGATAGIGVIEFRKFLWIDKQFTEAQLRQYALGNSEGVRLTGSNDWTPVSFELTTGDQTRMIHLVLFRDGAKDRNPVLFDDIAVVPAR